MPVDKTRLRDDLSAKFDVLFADPESPPSQQETLLAMAESILDEIVDNLSITGVQVDATNSIGAVVTAGVPVPMDGGASLKTTMLAASAPEIPSAQILSQQGDGTGLVS